MLRPSSLLSVALLLCTATGFVGCKTIYTDMYRPKKNYFKPEKDSKKKGEVLPETKIDLSAPTPPAPGAPADLGLPGAGAPAADPAAPAAGAPAIPAIPGL